MSPSKCSAGETRVLFGAAGSGKTTLLKVALGLLKPDSGRVFLFGAGNHAASQEQELFDLRARVGILFQEGGLFDSLTIAENVAYPLLNQRVLRPPMAGSRKPPKTSRSASGSLNFVELGQTLEKFPSELSGGMRRRVGIARAVVTATRAVVVRFAHRRPRSHHRQHHHRAAAERARNPQHRHPHGHPPLPGRASDGQLSLQSQQWEDRASVARGRAKPRL